MAEGDKIVVRGLVHEGGECCSSSAKNGRDFFGPHDGRAVRQLGKVGPGVLASCKVMQPGDWSVAVSLNVT